MSTSIAVIILTYNEEKHIERCIRSVEETADEIFVVDSYSDDRTTEIAHSLGANVQQNEWINYSTQFNWALQHCPVKSEWIWRLDADEYLQKSEVDLKKKIEAVHNRVAGLYIKRKIIFFGKEILHGGWYPAWHLKIWRRDTGYCESRWMDEHIKLKQGNTERLNAVIVDHNLNSLTWWIDKHNKYATREMVDMLDSEYNIFERKDVDPIFFGKPEQRKRWMKQWYIKMPLFLRPFLHFIYRYIFLAGFLDGQAGLVWHVLQSFWYRFLVDAKIFELKRKFNGDINAIIRYIRKGYGLRDNSEIRKS